LLEQADWPEPEVFVEAAADEAKPAPAVTRGRPTARPQPPPAAEVRVPDAEAVRTPGDGAIDRLRQAIDARHAAIDRSRPLRQLDTIRVEEAKLDAMLRLLKRCDTELTAAKRAFALVQAQATAAGPPGKAAAARLPAVRAAVDAAQRRFNDQARVVQGQRQLLQPLYRDAVASVSEWMTHYRGMRRCVGQDRSDTTGKAAVAILESAVTAREDFHDGRLLAAIAHVYHGDPTEAKRHLRLAQDENALAPYLPLLRGTDLGFDRSLAWVLLGDAGAVTADMQDWDARWLNHKSVRHLWLLALWYAGRGQDQEAERRFDRCLRAAGFNDANPPAIGAIYLGDSAYFYLATANPKLRKPDKARRILELLPAGDERWQVLRARAVALAEDGAWEPAAALLRDCEQRCPLPLVEEVRSQRTAYERKETWVRPSVKRRPAT
jgi:tetratricopeptide (TPR) repeat protein